MPSLWLPPGYRRVPEGHGTEAALPQQVGHILLGGLVADQQHIALLPVLADLMSLRREPPGRRVGVRRPSRSTAEGNTQGRKTTWALSCSSMGMFRSSQGAGCSFWPEDGSSASIRQGVQPGGCGLPPGGRPAGYPPQQLLLRHLTAGREDPSFFLGAYSFTAARAWASDISARSAPAGIPWGDHGGPLGVLQLLAGLADLHTAQVLQLVQQSP